MLLQSSVKRVGIFCFYDEKGVVDDYISYLLVNMKPFVSKLIIVYKEPLTKEGRTILSKYADELLNMDNSGFYVEAYKVGLQHLDKQDSGSYDEIVLFNNDIMGPVKSFETMFTEMSSRDLDFWGITKHGEYDLHTEGVVSEFVQSYFWCFRSSLFKSQEFGKYWSELSGFESSSDVFEKHEVIFTKYFENKGFSWDVYIDTDHYEELTTDPLMLYPKELIKNNGCPVFLRDSFIGSYEYSVVNTAGQSAKELLAYLKTETDFDTDLIWNTVLRTCNQSDFTKNMQLTYILSSQKSEIKLAEKEKVALVMHLYFPDLIEDSFMWASSMPEYADVYITTNTELKRTAIEAKFQYLKCNKLEIRVIENRGRDVSSLLVGVKDIVNEYDYVCFVHDKKTAQLKPGSVGEGFAYKCFSNTLYNRFFVENVINLFRTEPRLGLLTPPVPNHGHFFPVLGNEWGQNFENCVNLANKLGIDVPMDPVKEPVAPLGTMFWFKPEALKFLYDYDWDYKDFPEEPNNNDGTLLHAIERMYTYATQAAGFYPATVLADEYARIEVTSLSYYVRNYNRVLYRNGICNYHFQMCNDLSQFFGRVHVLENELRSKDTQVNMLENELSNKDTQINDIVPLLAYLDEKSKSLERELLAEREVVKELAGKDSLKYQLKNKLKKLLGLK